MLVQNSWSWPTVFQNYHFWENVLQVLQSFWDFPLPVIIIRLRNIAMCGPSVMMVEQQWWLIGVVVRWQTRDLYSAVISIMSSYTILFVSLWVWQLKGVWFSVVMPVICANHGWQIIETIFKKKWRNTQNVIDHNHFNRGFRSTGCHCWCAN